MTTTKNHFYLKAYEGIYVSNDGSVWAEYRGYDDYMGEYVFEMHIGNGSVACVTHEGESATNALSAKLEGIASGDYPNIPQHSADIARKVIENA